MYRTDPQIPRPSRLPAEPAQRRGPGVLRRGISSMFRLPEILPDRNVGWFD